MSRLAPVTVIILARSADAASARAIAAASAHAAEILVLVSDGEAALQLQRDWPAARVVKERFRNAAEALAAARAGNACRFWFWSEEIPDSRVWSHVARMAELPTAGGYAYELADLCGGLPVRCAPQDRPAVRLWWGDIPPLETSCLGLAVARPELAVIPGNGRIVHHGYGSVTRLIARVDQEIGRAVHAAVERGLTESPPALSAASLIRSWLAHWLFSGLRGGTRRMVKTFEHQFWIPLFLNARLREAANELHRGSRTEWLADHAHFAGEP